MSVFRRFRSWIGGTGEPENESDAEPEARAEAGAEAEPVAEPKVVAPRLSPPEAALESWIGDPDAQLDEDELLAHVRALAQEGRDARAIELARRILALHPQHHRLTLHVAELAASRGDTETAQILLAPVLLLAQPPLEAWMLAGELSEHRGDREQALASYERVLARDLDYPGAAERASRLREEREPRREIAGATLLADGALARGRWRLERELGRGGAGTVFLARDRTLDRFVALKVYHRRGKVERERLRVEARVPASLEHPGVVRIFDLDETLGAIAMENVLGGSIRMQMRRGAIPLETSARWLATAAEALAYVHARGIVHRDLKPSNFLLREDQRVVLTDFGLAAPAGEVTPNRAGGGEGTLAYMPPEQRAGAPAHPSQDIHAFGATMRELLSATSGEVPPRWLDLATECLHTKPEARPDIATLLAALA